MPGPIIDRLEKTSSLVRNVALIVGALATAWVFVADRWKEPLIVRTDTIYLGETESQEIGLAAPSQAGNPVSGPLGSLSDIYLENTTDLPIAVQVRMPSFQPGEEELSTKWPLFSVAEVLNTCSLLPSEIELAGGGYFPTGTRGTLSIPKFPPGCHMYLEVASTKVSKSSFLMNGRVEVYYDGKHAKVKQAYHLHGRIGQYASWIEENGTLGVLVAIFLPLVSGVLLITLAIQFIVKRGSAATTNA